MLRQPASQAEMAAARPAGPPPTTSRSTLMICSAIALTSKDAGSFADPAGQDF